MIPSPNRQKRSLVPRWRSLKKTISAKELGTVTPNSHEESLAKSGQIPPELRHRLETWRQKKDLLTSAELIETAIVYGHESEAINAARILLSPDSKATPILKRNAALLLKRAGLKSEIPENIKIIDRSDAKIWRARTRLYPDNALAWVELSLAQTINNSKNNATRSMKIAMQLAPTNRHILRSASRLFLHMGDAGKAYEILRRNTATPHDPWLMAAEVALAPLAEKSPFFLKKGRQLIDADSQNPHHISELAGAVGMTFLVDGNHKIGKKLFTKSMIDPTGNAVAQAQWASQHYHEHLVEDSTVKRHIDAKEANSFRHFQNAEYDLAFNVAKEWIDEEPFSGRAYLAGASAANMIENYTIAEKLSDEGLKHSPTSSGLLTARIFALACLSRFEDAEQLIQASSSNKDMSLILEADRGLIAMRRGQIEEGRNRYQAAISGFEAKRDRSNQNLALAYFAREAVLANIIDAKEILMRAVGQKPDQKDTTTHYILKKAEEMLVTRSDISKVHLSF